MTYQETLAHIFGLTRFGIRPGLERITALLDRLGNPQQRVRTVSIAGTNGKGSTAAFLSSILAAAGLKVGLFTSPHLISFTERFQINGREIGEAEVTELAAGVLAVAPPETTFFEIVTAMALHYFAREKVDLLVMEAGMGGRSDATNAADPLLSVLTPISYDHCEYLGDTLTSIAREKTGIIRKGRPVVSAVQESEAACVLADAAAAAGVRIFMAGRDFSGTDSGTIAFTIRKSISSNDFISKRLLDEFNISMKSYSQNPDWVERVFSKMCNFFSVKLSSHV